MPWPGNCTQAPSLLPRKQPAPTNNAIAAIRNSIDLGPREMLAGRNSLPAAAVDVDAIFILLSDPSRVVRLSFYRQAGPMTMRELRRDFDILKNSYTAMHMSCFDIRLKE